jgi:exopolysaccharide biosynthesis polyprenyl glycosylphosphotransferase
MLTLPERSTVVKAPQSPARRILILTDSLAILGCWLVVSMVLARGGLVTSRLGPLRLGAVVIAGIALMALDRLYRTEAVKVRAIEMVRLSRAAIATAIVAYFVGLVARGQRREAVIGAFGCFLVLAISRQIYAHWLQAAWRRREWLRSIVVIGNDFEAARVATLLDHHPEFGFEVCGLVADYQPPRRAGETGIRLLGAPSETVQIMRQTGATFAVMSAGGLSPLLRNRLLRELMAAGIHVQMSTGLSGISYRRLRALPLGHEPFFYVEPLSLGRPQVMLKRAVDLVAAPLALLITLPLLLLAAVAIKIEDRGPILFRQERVGRDGRRFVVYKLRTMVVDAESRLKEIWEHNERTGPLFKLAHDPRTTRIGRILRATSIDEIPQLFNVLNGTMTLVGPRPALPREVEQFDEELLGRLRVTPGITGLWQVEARDDPSFEAYRLYDMLYVDNWSFSLDLAIMAWTVLALVSRAVRILAPIGKADQGPDGSECERLGCFDIADRIGFDPLEDAEEMRLESVEGLGGNELPTLTKSVIGGWGTDHDEQERA